MALCDKCKKFLPPGFTHTENPDTGEPLKGNICIFCIRGTDVIKYDGGAKKATKKDIIKEYDIFLKQVKENNQLLKDGAKGEYVKGMEKFVG